MKSVILRNVSIGLLLAAPGAWCGAAPAPADLSELATFKMSRPCRVTGLIFSPDSKTLFSLDGRRVWLWDVASRKHTATLENIEEIKSARAVLGMALSPDGKMLATYRAKAILLWDVASRKNIAMLEEEGEVYSVVFSPEGKTLSAAVKAPRIPGPPRRGERWSPAMLQRWDVEKKKRVHSCKLRFIPTAVRADPSIKKPVMAVLGRPRDSEELRLPKPDEHFAFTLVDAFTGEAIVTCEGNREKGVTPMCFSYFALNRSETMVASSGFHLVQLWDRNSGKRIAVFEHVGGFTFSPDGKILAAGLSDNSFLLFAVPSGKILADRRLSSGASSLAFSPDGRLLATGGSGEEIKLWSIPERWRKDK
jgi:WD40 repeat protein